MRKAMATFIDIGANLLDPQFRGRYHGKRAHARDLPLVLERAGNAGVSAVLITGSNLREAAAAVTFCERHNAALQAPAAGSGTPPVRLYCTAGVHPCNAMLLEPEPAGTGTDTSVGTAEAGCGLPAPHCSDSESEGGGGSSKRPRLGKEAYVAALDELIGAGKRTGVLVAVGEEATAACEPLVQAWLFLSSGRSFLPS